MNQRASALSTTDEPAAGGRGGRKPDSTPPNGSPHPGGSLGVLGSLAVALLMATLGGCQTKEKEREYPNTNLGGFVTVDDAPIDDAMISFTSKDIRLGQVIVTRVTRGRYIAEKVPLGPVVVVISGMKPTGRRTRPGGPEEVVDMIPPRYRAGFELDVKEDTSQVDFKMTPETEPPKDETETPAQGGPAEPPGSAPRESDPAGRESDPAGLGL